MNEEIKAGIYIFDGKIKLADFDEKYLINGMKFIQLYRRQGDIWMPHIRAEKMEHKNILSTALEDFKINYGFVDVEGDRIPSHFGENYKMVGAGKILALESRVNFFGQSTDYANLIFETFSIIGTSRGHLEEMFGEENVCEDTNNRDIFPSYFVKI